MSWNTVSEEFCVGCSKITTHANGYCQEKNHWNDGPYGGRGTCEYCHEIHNNVAYHSAHECLKRPIRELEKFNVIDKILTEANGQLVYNARTGKAGMRQLLPIPSWDELFMRMVYLISTKSRDPRTKIGAIIVKDKRVISMGYNGFPGGVDDLQERYNNREQKYKFVVHAEDNTILTASRFGICTVGTTLYTNGIPCCECSKSIIQGGVKEIVIHKQWPDMKHSGWIESIAVSKTMLSEVGINIRIFDGVLNISSLLDGSTIYV